MQSVQSYDMSTSGAHHPMAKEEEDQSAISEAAQSKSGTGKDGPVRRRISRACDQCNQLRTKCDGKFPCAHCVGM